jgi:hypothetical protein
MPSERQREAARLLRIAHRDLKAASSMLDFNLFEEATWGYQIQQATEKALKAWIASLEHEYPRTHDLALLCRLIFDFGGNPTSYQPLVNFTAFATRLRYEEDDATMDLDRLSWNNRCADLLGHVASLIP